MLKCHEAVLWLKQPKRKRKTYLISQVGRFNDIYLDVKVIRP